MTHSPISKPAAEGLDIPNLTVAMSGSRQAFILIIEDDQVSHRILSKICTNSGHKVVIAENLAHAREELQRNVLFDLVFLDSQLGRDWGWNFLGELRTDALFRGLPVVVYTSHTERDALLQYIELGVQAVRAKPFKGEVVFAEIEKALQTDWRGRMMHAPSKVCERLRIKETDYYTMLSTAALEIEKGAKEIKSLVGTHNHTRVTEALRQLRSQGNMIGLPALELISNSIQSCLERQELAAAVRALQRIDLLVNLINLSCGKHYGEDSSQIKLSRPSEKAPELPVITTPLPPVHTVGAASHGRKLAAGPAWSIGKCFGRLKKLVVFSEQDIEQMIVDGGNNQPIHGFLDCLAAVEKIPGAGFEQGKQALAGLPAFQLTFNRIAEQLGVRGFVDDPVRGMEMMGVERTMILVEAARAASCALIESPLTLSHAMVHSVTTGLIAHELGRLLHLANSHLLFSLGLTHDIGRWLLAVEEPGFYTIAIGLAQAEGTDMGMAEKLTFGHSQEELGRRVLERAGLRRLYLDSAGHHLEPASAEIEPDNRVSVSLIHLARDLAYAAAADHRSESDQIVARISAKGYPVWSVLSNSGVEIPMSGTDLVQRCMTLASTCQWVTLVLGSWAAGVRRA